MSGRRTTPPTAPSRTTSNQAGPRCVSVTRTARPVVRTSGPHPGPVPAEPRPPEVPMRAFRLGTAVAGAALLVLFSAGPALADQVRVTGSGSGAEEAPDPGEDGATIKADFTIDTETGAITYTVTVAGNSEEAAAAHIHRAPPGEPGDVVVELDPAAINAGEEASATADPAVAA